MAKKAAKKAGKLKTKSAKHTPSVEVEQKAIRTPRDRKTVVEVLPSFVKKEDPRWVMSRDQLEHFAPARISSGLIDVDLVFRPAFGKRIQLIGERSVGKTVLTYILGGAAQRTCRHCWMPIIPWLNEKTGEIKDMCMCRANEPMVVVHVDVEDCFDPKWAMRWRVDLDTTPIEQAGSVTYKNRSETFWVVVPRVGNEALDFVDEMIRSGAADFVIIDSIALTAPAETLYAKDKEGKTTKVGIGLERMSPRARLLAQGITKLVNAMINAKLDYGARPTLLMTNQYYLGPTRNPKMDPRHPVGGKRVGYATDMEMTISAKQHAGTTQGGIEKVIQYLDVTFNVTKGKAAGPSGGVGHYRLYTDDVVTGRSVRRAGDTDEPERLVSYLQQLGLFDKGKSSFMCLGREFKRISDMRSFLSRPDIQYLARYPILSALVPATALDYLEEKFYAYSPFDRDPLLDLVKKSSVKVPADAGGPGNAEEAEPESDGVAWPE